MTDDARRVAAGRCSAFRDDIRPGYTLCANGFIVTPPCNPVGSPSRAMTPETEGE